MSQETTFAEIFRLINSEQAKTLRKKHGDAAIEIACGTKKYVDVRWLITEAVAKQHRIAPMSAEAEIAKEDLMVMGFHVIHCDRLHPREMRLTPREAVPNA